MRMRQQIWPLALFGTLFLAMFACREDRAGSVVHQISVVDSLEVRLDAESRRLQNMHDSAQVYVEQDVALGLTRERALSIQDALIEVQKTVVKATRTRLEAERDLLEVMQGR